MLISKSITGIAACWASCSLFTIDPAAAYNVAHTYVLPVALAAIGVLAGSDLAVELGLIWLMHIGVDRAIGYGLKYPTGFKDTHLQRV